MTVPVKHLQYLQLTRLLEKSVYPDTCNGDGCQSWVDVVLCNDEEVGRALADASGQVMVVPTLPQSGGVNIKALIFYGDHRFIRMQVIWLR